MPEQTTSQIAGSGSPASTPAAPGTKSIEQLMAENDALRREKDSLQGSVQGLARKNQEFETRLKEFETAPQETPPSDTGEAEIWVTRTEAARLADERIQAWETQRRQDAEAARQAAEGFQTERQRWLKQAETDIPESLDKTSPVYKKALELFVDPTQGLSVGGVPKDPNAEYVAFARAKLVLSTQAQQASESRTAATFASPGGPSSGSTSPGRDGLSDEDFLKLSPEQQTKYQDDQFRRKFGG